MNVRKGWIKAGLLYTTVIAFACAGTTPSQPPSNTSNNDNSINQKPTFYTKTLGKSLIDQINAMDGKYGATLDQVNPAWKKSYQLVMQNINSLSVNDPTYGAYVETAANMLQLIPNLINTNGAFQPYNSSWSLIQGKDGTLYNVDGTVATNVARTMTQAQVNEISNKMVDVNVRFGQALAQIDPNLSN